MKIFLEIDLSDDLAQELMQVLRDFDTKHDPNHEDKVVVRVLAKSSHTVAEMEAVFRALDPPCRNIKAIPHDARKN